MLLEHHWGHSLPTNLRLLLDRLMLLWVEAIYLLLGLLIRLLIALNLPIGHSCHSGLILRTLIHLEVADSVSVLAAIQLTH